MSSGNGKECEVSDHNSNLELKSEIEVQEMDSPSKSPPPSTENSSEGAKENDKEEIVTNENESQSPEEKQLFPLNISPNAPKSRGSVIMVKNIEEVRGQTSTPEEAELIISRALSDWRRTKTESGPNSLSPTRSPSSTPKKPRRRTGSGKKKRKSIRESLNSSQDNLERTTRVQNENDKSEFEIENNPKTTSIKFSQDEIFSDKTENSEQAKKKGSRIKFPNSIKKSQDGTENDKGNDSTESAENVEINMRPKKKQLNPYQRLSQKFNRKSVIQEKKEKPERIKKNFPMALQRQDSEVNCFLFAFHFCFNLKKKIQYDNCIIITKVELD